MMDNLGGIARFYSLGADTSTGGSYQFNSLSSNATAGVGAVMTILNNGDVGIGTTSPAKKLHVLASNHMVTFENISSAANTYTQMLLKAGTAHSYIWTANQNSTNWGGPNSLNIYTQEAGAIAFFTTTIKRMTIAATGNVGVGTASPASKLHVQGGAIGVTTGQKIGWLYSPTTTPPNNEMYNYILTADNGGVPASPLEISGSRWTSGNTRGVIFTHQTAGEIMTIMTGGNVGINNTSPGKKLEISSPTSGDGILLTGDGTGGGMSTGSYRSIGFSYTDTDTSYGSEMKFEIPDSANHGGQISFWTDEITSPGNSVRAMTISRSQNVGIGTASPASKLDISGGRIGIRNNIVAASNLTYSTIYSTENTGAAYPFTGTSGNLVVEPRNGQDFVVLGTSGVAKMVVKGGGNVGIGTTGPGFKLHVVSSVPEAACFDTTSSSYGAMNIFKAQGVTKGASGYNSGSMYFGGESGTNTIIQSGGQTGIFINNSTRYVGIGTTLPGHKLEVNGGIRAGIAGNASANTPALKVYAAGASSSTTAAIAIQQGTNEGDTIIFADYEPHVEWGISAQNSTDQIHFTSGGSTNSLGSKIVYNNAGAARTAYIKFNHSLGDGHTLIGGNLGLGVTSATEKLVVAGKVMLNSSNAPNNLAELNIGYTGGGETRAIDIDGGWGAGESKSISFTYSSSATTMVGQINCQHTGPGSRIRWGKLHHSGDSSTYTMELISSSQTTANLTVAGNITAAADVVAYSDERLKSNIKTLDGSKVLKMRGVSFEKEGKKGSGVIAQELEKVAPELVNNDNEYKGVAYGNLTGYLIEAIKELKAEIEELKKYKCDCKR
jgi:hypothetical protein